ncbi:MAG: S1 RNA-binding domain-containing protein, partial [Aggregatilineales bacterium]
MNTDTLEPGINGNGMENEFASFEQMLDAYIYDEPERGQILEGTIIENRRDEIILDVGLKRDAVVTRKDLSRLSDEVLERLLPGTAIQTYVLQPYNSDGDLVVSINKALELEDWSRAVTLMESDDIVESRVVDSNRGGLLVQFGRLTGFVPNSHIESMSPSSNAGRMIDAK